VYKWIIQSCCIVLSLSVTGTLTAQQSDQAPIANEHVRLTKGVSIGLTGVSTFYIGSLIDELGFEYDTMSLLEKPEIRTAVSIEDDQYTELLQAQYKFFQEARSNGLGTDTDEQQFKDRFLELENELTGMLSNEQHQRLIESRIQLGMALLGIREFLSSEQMSEKLGLTESDLKLMPTKAATTKQKNAQLSKSIREANKKIVAKLKRIQAEELTEFFDDFDSDFLSKQLFVRDVKKSISNRLSRIQILHCACKKQTIKMLDLEADQVASLEELRRNIEADQQPVDEIAKVMKTEQFQKFERIFAARQINKWGTVRALSDGYLRQMLRIESENAKQLVKLGKQLHAELNNLEVENMLSGISELSDRNQEKIRNLIGDRIMFDLK